MFTEHEIESMLEYPEVKEATIALKKNFIGIEAPYLEISDEDFFSLIVMIPAIDLAMADGKITLFEEIALNKKARKLSVGGFFMKKDPVVYAMKYLIKNYHKWLDKFIEILRLTIKVSCNLDSVPSDSKTVPLDPDAEIDYKEYRKVILHSPYLLIRFISSFFLEKDEDIINKNHTIDKLEFERMILIGKKLELDKTRVFQMFCQTYK